MFRVREVNLPALLDSGLRRNDSVGYYGLFSYESFMSAATDNENALTQKKGNHKGCPYQRLTGVIFRGMADRARVRITSLWRSHGEPAYYICKCGVPGMTCFLIGRRDAGHSRAVPRSFYLAASNAARKPGSEPSSVASVTQYDMRKWPGPPNPLPGTTRTRLSLSMPVNSTSSSMGAFGNM